MNVFAHRLSALALAVQIALLPAWQISAFASENVAQSGTTRSGATEEYAQEVENKPAEGAEAGYTGGQAAQKEDPSAGYTGEVQTAQKQEESPVCEGTTAVTEEYLEEGENGADIQSSQEELLENYLNNRLYGTQSTEPVSGFKMLFKSATRSLSGLNADVYTALLENVKMIADGKTDYSVITIPISGFLEKTSFTAAELGVDTIYEVKIEDGSGEKVYKLSSEAREAIYDRIGWRASAVMNHLITNCPYELYWYDKTKDYYHSITLSYNAPEETIFFPDQARVRFYLPVSADYAATEEYTLDTEKTGRASKSVERAGKIVSDASGLSDWEKLSAYRDAIFDLVSYDSTVSMESMESSQYGNPWQIIYVFDGDSGTGVVCEGYAKAFQYLCDLTDWKRQIECHTVTGMLGTDNPQKHMWNVVSLWDGCNFVVDLTNSDEGKPGYPDQLFMTGADDYEDGTFTLMDGSLCYAYDAEMEELYTDESIRITSLEAHDPHYYEGMTPDFIWDEAKKSCKVSVVCGLCDEVHYFDAEVTSAEKSQEGLTQYTAVFYAEDHSFTDSVTFGDSEEDSGTDSTESAEGSSGASASQDDSSGQNIEEDSSEPESEDSSSAAPRAGDINAESAQIWIGIIILCAIGIAAAALFIRKNRGQIREICTDEDGKIDLMGGLERHFTKGSGGYSPEEENPKDTVPDERFMTMLRRQEGARMADLDTERDIIREHIIFRGRVQGVGFRYQAMYAARSFDLTGWVENLPDGSVEMEVQGTPAGIGRMLKRLQSGSWIRIDDMEIESMPPAAAERGFGVRGY